MVTDWSFFASRNVLAYGSFFFSHQGAKGQGRPGSAGKKGGKSGKGGDKKEKKTPEDLDQDMAQC